MNRRFAILASVATVWVGAPVLAADVGRKYGPGVSDTEIRIGQTMPYSGAYSAAGVIGRTERAYFKTINAHGGINGRRVRVHFT